MGVVKRSLGGGASSSTLVQSRRIHVSSNSQRQKDSSAPKPSRRPARHKKPSFSSSKPFKFQGFDLPTPPPLPVLASEIITELDKFHRVDNLDRRLVAFGSSSTSGVSHEQSDEDLALQLFHVWKGMAKVQISNLTKNVEDLKPGDVIDSGWNLDLVAQSYMVEGKPCLQRHLMAYFLDWIESELKRFDKSALPEQVASEIDPTLTRLALPRSTCDLRAPANKYPLARTLTRQIHLHIGPTNSGKTHRALVALSKAKTGLFAGPLRLLAHEVWERMNEGTISPEVAPRACNLLTGEEQKVVDPLAGLVSCTVEMANLSRPWDVAVIDEIQMIGDPQRGFAWTEAVLGLPAKELYLCGEASTVPLIKRMAEACGDVVHVHEYKRLTPLTVASESLKGDLSSVRRGDCVVAFSRNSIFALKKEIEQKTGLRCAVAYGALPPETKSEQAKMFNEGKLDVMVASDAIGMGLNLKIKRVIFDTTTKWNGKETVTLSSSQIKQIAGRAGRYGTNDEEGKRSEPLGGIATTKLEDELDILRQALEAPIVPIEKAAIQPSSETLASLATIVPETSQTKGLGWAGTRRLSTLYKDVSLLAQVDPRSYFLSDFSQQYAISPLVESSSSGMLTIAEREKFANAPANTRDPTVMEFLHQAVRLFSKGELAEFNQCAEGLRMLEIAEMVQKAMDLSKQDKNGLLDGSHDVFKNPEVFNIDTLMRLESLHRSLSLYLWLSFRFPLSFCYRADTEKIKKRIEDSIEFCLQGIRFSRARRLRDLGRISLRLILPRPRWIGTV
ncbi:P-loop containing nucleoside triphosphate hydrolase protein [Violaceomyces palustris]|uniref:P-loop containing nucleoside triphosphate hydrolase protein n=1 Tax=Violaceomyces palustris TaxID=1673888 RepID=A0ACD0P5G0_9BASI|nr:P-loop containing nucleoside triphosphate hydrolase protein [Violaceomyces palustris]